MARATSGDIILELMATVAQLNESMKQQAKQVAELSTNMQGNVHQFGRLAKLLADFAKATDERFDELDVRVGRLEAASGK